VNILQGDRYLWKLPQDNKETVLALAVSCSLSVPVAQTLVERGFTTKEQVEDFLFTTLEKDVPDVALMQDAQKAVDRIAKAIKWRKDFSIW